MRTIQSCLGSPASRQRLYVFVLVAAAAVLRLWGLGQMEFKGDEAECINLGRQLLHSRPWSTGAPWPQVGLVSSGGIMNPPLYNSLAAVMWFVTGSPVGCAAIIAIVNVICLPPLYLWARQFMSSRRALIVLGWLALSPFAVIHSRKLWPPELMLPGVVLLLWGLRYWQKGGYWLGAGLLFWSVLFISQLHLSGPVYLVAIFLGVIVNMAADAKRGCLFPLRRPRLWESLVLSLGLGVLVFYTTPYLRYLQTLHPSDFKQAALTTWPEPQWLYRLAAVVVPIELQEHFSEHWSRFLAFPAVLTSASFLRWFAWVGAIYTGIPLALRGAAGWLSRPNAIAIMGGSWICFILLFSFLRLPAFGQYPLVILPLPALLIAGAFEADPPSSPNEWRWTALRWGHVVLLGLLSFTSVSWCAERGGSGGDYGVGYGVQLEQARAIVAKLKNEPRTARPTAAFEQITVECHEPQHEVPWLVGWIAPELRPMVNSVRVCEGWPNDETGDLPYRWQLEE